jgi:hypothetical protein
VDRGGAFAARFDNATAMIDPDAKDIGESFEEATESMDDVFLSWNDFRLAAQWMCTWIF